MRFFVVLFVTILSFPSLADLQDDYVNARLQLFQGTQVRGLIAEKELEKFDATTAIGRYFRFSIQAFSRNLVSSPLSEQDIAQLQKEFSELYIEYQIVVTYFSDTDNETKISELERLQDKARFEGWTRITRWLTALLVELETATGDYGHALFRLYEEIDFAPELQSADTKFDYSFAQMHRDMASILYFLGEYEKSFEHCRIFLNALPKESLAKPEGALCDIRVQLKVNEYEGALKKIDTLISKLPSEEISVLVNALSLRAEALLAINRLEGAQKAGQEALTTLSQKPKIPSNDIFNISHLLSKIYLELGDETLAKTFSDQAEKNIGGLKNSQHHIRALLRIQSKIAEKQENYELAVTYYNRLYEEIKTSTHALPWKKIERISTQLNNDKIETLRKSYNEENARSRIVKGITITLTALLVLALILYFKITAEKTSLERQSQIDIFTDVFNHWFTINLIESQLRENVPGSLALFSVSDTTSLDAENNDVRKIATYIKSFLSGKQLIGRYKGSTFLIWLPQLAVPDAQNLLNEIRLKCINRFVTTATNDGPTFLFTVDDIVDCRKLAVTLDDCESKLAEKAHAL